MALLTGSWLLDLFSLLTTLLVLLVAWFQWTNSYWSRRGLFSPPSRLFFGHAKGVFTQTESFATFTLDIYRKIKAGNRLHGGSYFLFLSSYVPVDPDLIKRIMTTDFNNFVDRGIYMNEAADPLSAHLFSLEGAQWRHLRAKLTPTFTSGKMKMMFETLVRCSDQLTIEMDKTAGGPAINIKDVLVRFTIDIIGTCAFGIDCNSLKDPTTEFNVYASQFFVEDFWENIKGFLSFAAPELAQKLGVIAIKPSVAKFFMRVVRETVDYREKNNVHRKDFMHLLLQLKNRGEIVDDNNVMNADADLNDEKVKLTLNQLAAQAFVFFLAGFETSSTTMTFCLFELATNPDVQEKLREEVQQVLGRHNDQITYEALMEMHYMEKVINETLRKYPPLPSLNRICTKEYRVPGTDVVLEKGTKVFIPVLGLQRDEEYYPNPEKFDPERFSEENKATRHPYTYLPFGEGPRICIGLRFGIMQTKVGLSVLLKNYRFSLNEKTQVPLHLDERSFILATKGGIWLDYTKI